MAAPSLEKLHAEGFTGLPGGMPEWELRRFIEGLHRRYHRRITAMIEAHRRDWQNVDKDGRGSPGAGRPGAEVARRVTEALRGRGIYVYAAHPSQADDEEDDVYTGPRWYVSCMEAAMRRYSQLGVAPMPPEELRHILWPDLSDRRRPWLTELGWTVVPEGSDPQVLHADICGKEDFYPRRAGHGRYHHFVWKPGENKGLTTTQFVPGAFTEGCTTWDHYEQLVAVSCPALIFDSEMLHRGGVTHEGKGWTSTLTLQVCSGTGWTALQARVGAGMMEYTQPLGWEAGAAVDAFFKGNWCRGLVEQRSKCGKYSVALSTGGKAMGLRDCELRWRQAVASGGTPTPGPGAAASFSVGDQVLACFSGSWHAATVERRNNDSTFRVMWQQDTSFTDGLRPELLRLPRKRKAAAGQHGPPPPEGPPSPEAALPDLADTGLCRKCSRRPDSEPVHAVGKPALELSVPAPARRRLFEEGCVEFANGFPSSEDCDLLKFVEFQWAHYHALIVEELEALRHLWMQCDSGERPGEVAANRLSAKLGPSLGITLYSPGPSQAEEEPFAYTGPRWYVSITKAALKQLGTTPVLPSFLRRFLDVRAPFHARGLGWTLAPPGSDPQALHADIWGVGPHHRRNRNDTRWPHLLWKQDPAQNCTTQVVVGGFKDGSVSNSDYCHLKEVKAPAILVDSEVLHRGGPTLAEADGGGWASTLSIEFCTAAGLKAWRSCKTAGTVYDPMHEEDWEMLPIACSK